MQLQGQNKEQYKDKQKKTLRNTTKYTSKKKMIEGCME